MRHTLYLFLAAILSAGCGGSSTSAAAGPASYKADFKTAGFFTLMTKPVDNSGRDAQTYVHKLQRTWYSNNIKDAFSADVPVGTVAIKETYDATEKAQMQFVMIKKSKDTWQYEVRGTDGQLNSSEPMGDNVAGCHGCHTKFKATDYLGGTTTKS